MRRIAWVRLIRRSGHRFFVMFFSLLTQFLAGWLRFYGSMVSIDLIHEARTSNNSRCVSHRVGIVFYGFTKLAFFRARMRLRLPGDLGVLFATKDFTGLGSAAQASCSCSHRILRSLLAFLLHSFTSTGARGACSQSDASRDVFGWVG